MNPLQEPAEFVVHRARQETVSDFNRAHLWLCDLDEDCQPEEPGGCWLSADERARAERLKSQLERRRFVARCAFVRQVLARLNSGLARKKSLARWPWEPRQWSGGMMETPTRRFTDPPFRGLIKRNS